MAIKKLTELPKGKRATAAQSERAKKAKPITTKPKIIGVRHGRMEINLGTHDKQDVAGVIKGFRRKFKADFGTIIKDADGNVLARTHTASGKTTIPEQLAVKALAKYGKGNDQIKIVLSSPQPKRKKAAKKSTVKKGTKKQKVTPTKKKPTTKKAATKYRKVAKKSKKVQPRKTVKKGSKRK